jgi:peptide/nickel transport system substrate-binding protein
MVQPVGRLSETYQALRQGTISRRQFIARAAALGIGAPMALVLVNSIGMDGAATQDTLPERPSFGTEEQTRGAGGELKVRQWRAPDHAFGHLADFPPPAVPQVSSLILEPLLSYAQDGSLLPTLAAEVPTKANGGLSDDLTIVTLNLMDDLLWSDGEPFTADDVVWTWQWITDESNNSTSHGFWSEIQLIEATKPTQVRLIYAKPALAWFAPIAGAFHGGIIPRHVWTGKDSASVNADFARYPIGTGPYKIDSFDPGKEILCSINPHYRELNKPWFATVRFQEGGDGITDAQAVLQDGEGDVAAVLMAEPEILQEIESAGGKGRVYARPPTAVEYISFNFSDPNQEIDGERSSLQSPHPFLTDPAVRAAMAMAIDRESISTKILHAGDFWPPARNILTGIPTLESPNTSFEFDIDAANQLLDDAGWVRVGNTRIKDDIALEVSYYTMGLGSNNQLVTYRQKTQEAVKAAWEAIGITVQAGLLPFDDFLNVTPENEHSVAHFYRDVQMYARGPDSPMPDTFFLEWYAGSGNSNVAQQANDWSGWNLQRYINPDFDLLYEEAASTTDPERAAELYIEMNDLIVGDFVVVPLVTITVPLYALSNRIATENVGASSWEPLFWNIANWRTVEE